jgi:hypothetical protein
MNRCIRPSSARTRARNAVIPASFCLLLCTAPALAGQGQGSQAAPAAARQAPAAYDHGVAPTARAIRITEDIAIDGRFDEAVWLTAPAVTQLFQSQPAEGQPVTERTEVRFLYDDDFLYVGGWMWDRGEVLSRLARRDAGLPDVDVFAVHLDPYHNHRTGVRLATSPSGWIRDEFIVGGRGGGVSGGSADISWDPIWETKATVTEEGWFVEMAIPFSQLRYGSEEVQTWGLQIERKIRRHGEDNVWAFIPRTQPQGVARYGHLEGLQGLRQSRGLEILPYSTGRAEYRDIPQSPSASFSNPFRSGSDYFGNVGADLKYRLGTNFTLDATANPDFGQVELDPAVINLTAFETRFDEKRPFFVEGADIFRFGDGGGGPDAQLLYSRRIGRPPQGSVPSQSLYADIPSATTILGAAKVTGRTAGGWSMGVLNALSDREVVPWVDATGVHERAEVEPLTNYFAARLRRDVNEGARAFGVIATAVNRNLRNEMLESRLRGSAYTAGVDGRLEWNNRDWGIGGKLAASHVAGSTAAIASTQLSSARYFARPDADHLDYDPNATSLSGYYGTLSVGKQNGAWQGDVGVTATSPGFEVNDLGFQSAADRIDFSGSFGYSLPTPGRRFRSFSVNASGGTSRNFGGETLSKDASLAVNATHISQNGGNVRFSKTFESWSDRLTRGGPLTLQPGGWSTSAGFNTDSRNALQGRFGLNYSNDDAGGWRKGGNANFTLRFKDIYEVSLGMNLSQSRSPAQYVTAVTDAAATGTFGNRYVFAAIDQTTLDVNSRASITFTPELTLELYVQPFVSSGDYLALKELRAPRTFDFLEYGRDAGTITRQSDGRYLIDPVGNGARTFTISDRDFNQRSLMGNSVLRWEWRPGSTLFLVWQHGRSQRLTPGAGVPEGTYGSFELGRDARALFDIEPENTFMVKVSYWLSP